MATNHEVGSSNLSERATYIFRVLPLGKGYSNKLFRGGNNFSEIYMKIAQVNISKLFGVFHHSINFNCEERITIIHGPNGVGKTILLTMLFDLFTRDHFNIFFKVPFEEFGIKFDNGFFFSIKKLEKIEKQSELEQLRLLHQHAIYKDGLQRVTQSLHIQHKDKKGKNLFSFDISEDSLKSYKALNHPEQLRYIRRFIRNNIPELEEITPRYWINIKSGERLSIEDIHNKYNFASIFEEVDKFNNFKELVNCINIQLIETQRLLKLDKKKIESSSYLRSSEVEEDYSYTVELYSEKLARSIRDYRDKYAALTQRLDRSFPLKLLERKAKEAKTPNELKEKLREVEKSRKQLIEIGLLDEEEGHNFTSMLDKIKIDNTAVLTVYAEDMEQKLQVFRELAEKIELFKEIIDKKFRYKVLKFGKSFGFTFYTAEGKHLSLKDLSSGEQHEIVLLYELLFNIKPNSLILIDEPELSLHVAWQREFLKDLQRISKLSDLSFLIATHSPAIIADRWDLTVELSGE
jgi:predicted ATP-binding protein involved in virulence